MATKHENMNSNVSSVTYEPEYVSPQPLAGVVDFVPYELEDNEPYMNERQYAHFQNILVCWREKLLAGVNNTVHHMKKEAIGCPDPVDRASLEEGFNLELRTRDRERQLLTKITKALQSIADDEYGYCESCGADIGIRRLEARPTANKCIDCKTFEEIKEKQDGR